jgi:hypothetical protein
MPRFSQPASPPPSSSPPPATPSVENPPSPPPSTSHYGLWRNDQDGRTTRIVSDSEREQYAREAKRPDFLRRLPTEAVLRYETHIACAGWSPRHGYLRAWLREVMSQQPREFQRTGPVNWRALKCAAAADKIFHPHDRLLPLLSQRYSEAHIPELLAATRSSVPTHASAQSVNARRELAWLAFSHMPAAQPYHALYMAHASWAASIADSFDRSPSSPPPPTLPVATMAAAKLSPTPVDPAQKTTMRPSTPSRDRAAVLPPASVASARLPPPV